MATSPVDLSSGIVLVKKTRFLKYWSKRNLPEELWPEILSRLPVKSLLRFRCVCKSWKSLIDDPEFCSLHLNRFKNNYLETHLLVAEGRKNKQTAVAIKCSRTLRTTRRLGSLSSIDASTDTHPIFPALSQAGLWDVNSSMDGLVMLRRRNQVSTPELLLWNPSIRKTRSIPSLPKTSGVSNYVDMGLGFDPLIQDYKHVRLLKQTFGVLHSIDIYTVGTGSWKTIKFKGKGCSSWQWYFDFGRFEQAVCFMGCLYIIDMNWNTKAWELISFDLSNEAFAFTGLPEYDERFNCYQYHAALFDGGRSLAVCQLSNYHSRSRGSMWVLEGSGINADSRWTKLHTFSICPIDEFLYLKKNGELLLGKRYVSSHNTRTGEQRRVLENSRNPDLFKVCHYIESLILLN